MKWNYMRGILSSSIRFIVGRTIGPAVKWYVRRQLPDLDVSLSDDELRIFEQDNTEGLPRFAQFSLKFKNNSNIPFHIERICFQVEATGNIVNEFTDEQDEVQNEAAPNRNRRKSYPVVLVDEDPNYFSNINIGHIQSNSNQVNPRRQAGNTQYYQTEFMIPAWLEPDDFYIRGFYEIQQEIILPIDLQIRSGDIEYAEPKR